MNKSLVFFILFSAVTFQASAQEDFYVATNEVVYIEASNTLTVQGNLTNNGTISGSGILSLSGSSAQTVSGTGSVKHITVNNAAGVVVGARRIRREVNKSKDKVNHPTK